MQTFENPVVKAFVGQLGEELTLAEVLIRRVGAGFELRHVKDREVKPESFRKVSSTGARARAQFTASGEFRPLKSAPTLQRGWQLKLSDNAQLESALNQLYPGAIADWFASRAASPPVTNYRQFANRQSGMYRAMALLDDAQVSRVIQVTCAKTSCLKRRLWTVEGLEPDAMSEKSLIPCLEPCAILMEAARKALRAEQQKAGAVRVEACAEDEAG